MPTGLGRSLSDHQEVAQYLGGDALPRTLLTSVLQKTSLAEGGTIGVVNLTPYDGWLEKTCHKGFDGFDFKTLSLTKSLQIGQFVEKSLALDLMEDPLLLEFNH